MFKAHNIPHNTGSLKWIAACAALFCIIIVGQGCATASAATTLPSDVCDATVDWGFDPTRTCYGGPRTTDFGNTYVYRPAEVPGQPPSPYRAARALPGQSQALDLWGQCRYVTVGGANAVFIPFSSAREWSAFIAMAGASNSNLAGIVRLNTCAREIAAFPIPAGNALCANNITVHLPYAPTGAQIRKLIRIPCSNTCLTNPRTRVRTCGPWHQAAQVTFEALNSEPSDNVDDWKIVGQITYYNIIGPVPTP